MQMTRRQWVRECAQELVRKGGMDQDAAAALAENCAALEESYTAPVEMWATPVEAADAEIASWSQR